MPQFGQLGDRLETLIPFSLGFGECAAQFRDRREACVFVACAFLGPEFRHQRDLGPFREFLEDRRLGAAEDEGTDEFGERFAALLVLVTLDRFDEAGAEAVSYKMLCPRRFLRRFSVSYKMLCPRRFS